jgi:hypothetical protein
MERRPLTLRDLDHAVADAEALLASGYDRAGTWGLAQVCDHLARPIEMSLDGFPSRFPWPMRVLARWFVLGRILRRKVIRRRFPAPKEFVPAEGGDERAAIERLRAAARRFEAHTGPVQPSPVFGRLTKEQWRSIHLWHCEHHLSFLLPRAAR